MLMDRIDRWSGLAAAAGGLLWLFPWARWPFEVSDRAGFFLAIVGLLLVIVGLTGLYRRLTAGQSSMAKPAFGLAVTGAALIMASAIGGLVTNVSLSGIDSPSGVPILLPILLFGGMLLAILGIAGMGLVTLRQKALGRFSFAPLLLAASLLVYVISIGMAAGDVGPEATDKVFLALVVACWLLLGISLSTSREQTVDAALPA